MKKTLKEIWSS